MAPLLSLTDFHGVAVKQADLAAMGVGDILSIRKRLRFHMSCFFEEPSPQILPQTNVSPQSF